MTTQPPPLPPVAKRRLLDRVNEHSRRCSEARNPAVALAEHAQALGILTALDVMEEGR